MARASWNSAERSAARQAGGSQAMVRRLKVQPAARAAAAVVPQGLMAGGVEGLTRVMPRGMLASRLEGF